MTLRLESIHPRSSSYRATFHLYLNYYFARIAMGKLGVVARVRSYLRNHLSGDPQVDMNDCPDRLSEACIKAAKKILRLYEDVRRTGNLTRFSFTDFQGCSVATSLVLLAGIFERDSDYERHVSFGLDSLQKMAHGNTTATAGLKFVEALQSIAEEAKQRLRQHDASLSNTAVSNAGGAVTQTSDYSTWADWLARQPTQPRSGTRTPLNTDVSTNTAGEELPNAMDLTTWDEFNALQPSSVPSISMQPGGVQYDINSGPAEVFDSTMFTADYNDDNMFLMGLTGFDMMGFGFQN